MSGGLVLLANLVTAVVLVGAAVVFVFRRPSRASWLLAAFPLAMAVLLCVYVFGEDDYRDTGISRWDAYRSPGGALGPMFVLSVALLTTCAVLIVVATRRGDERLSFAASLLGGLGSFGLVTATIIGFTAN